MDNMAETSKKQAARNARGQLQKGHTANPNGRPKKGYSITEMMRSMLEAQPELREGIAKSVAKKALQGDIAAIKAIWNYMDGMPPQEIKFDPATMSDEELNAKITAIIGELEKEGSATIASGGEEA